MRAALLLTLLVSGVANASCPTCSTEQKQAATAASLAAAGNSLVFNSAQPNDRSTLVTAPQIYAPPIGVTAPCYVALSAAVSVVGFGVGAGSSIEDPNCTRRENARVLHGIGQSAAAARIMCNDREAAAALGPAICQEAK